MDIVIKNTEKRLIKLCLSKYPEGIRFPTDTKSNILNDYIDQFDFNDQIEIFVFLNNSFLKKIGITPNYCYLDNDPCGLGYDSKDKSNTEILRIIKTSTEKMKQKINQLTEKAQLNHNIQEKNQMIQEINNYISIHNFIVNIPHLHTCFVEAGVNMEYNNIFIDLFYELDSRLDDYICIPHIPFLGDIGSKCDLDDFDYLKGVIEFYFYEGWLNRDIKMSFPAYIFIKLFSWSGKHSFNINKLNDEWNRALDEQNSNRKKSRFNFWS